MRAGQSHITSITVNSAAENVFERMADAANLHRWSFGTWKTEIAADGLVLGTSLFDGSRIFVRIDKDEARLIIDYHLGADPKKLVPRIQLRVVPGGHVGLFVSSKSQGKLSQSIADWLVARDTNPGSEV